MNDKLMTNTVMVIIGLLGVATIAVLVSKQSNTGGLFSSFGKALSCSLGTALSPILGGSSSCSGSTPFVNSTITFG